MRQSNPIADYAEIMARELSFDRALARRVRAEVEDHLWEAVGDAPESVSPAMQHRMIADFGDPREIARQYVAASLLAQMRRVAVLAVLAAIAIFVAMKGRVSWYGLMQWKLNQDWSTVSAIGLAVDRYAFMLAISIALIGCGYIATRQIPDRFHPGYGKELNRGILLYATAAAGLLVVVATDTFLTSLRLLGMAWRADAIVPALSLAAEIAAAAALVLYIRGMIRRREAACSLLQRGAQADPKSPTSA